MRGYRTVAEHRALRTLVRPLCERLNQRDLSNAELARRIHYSRSQISRAMSGRYFPTRELTEKIAEQLWEDVKDRRDDVMRRWDRVDALRRKAGGMAVGGPPAGMGSYDDLIRALRELRAESRMSLRELAVADRTGCLKSSTVGAVLRGERTASSQAVDALVRACGVSDDDADAWYGEWCRLAAPEREARRQKQLDGLMRRRYAETMGVPWA